MIKRLALLCLISVFFLPVTALAAEPGNGMIDGRVVNDTVGGGSTASLEVVLKVYQGDAETDSQMVTTTDEAGYFVFEGVSTDPQYRYAASVEYQMVEYVSQRLGFAAGETSQFAGVTVWDATTDASAISVTMSHMIVYAGEDSLLLKEYYYYVNMSDRTYLGPEAVEGGPTLFFSLPRGATGFQPTLGLADAAVLSSDVGFADTMPLVPGGKEIAFSYQVPYDGSRYTLTRTVQYPIANYDILIEGNTVEASGDQLVASEPLDIQGTQYAHLSRTGLQPGDALSVSLDSGQTGQGQGAVIWAVVLLVAVAGAFTLIYRMRKRPAPVSAAARPETQREQLLAELARLDDNFAGGIVPEADYHRLRQEKKAQLVELMRRSEEENRSG